MVGVIIVVLFVIFVFVVNEKEKNERDKVTTNHNCRCDSCGEYVSSTRWSQSSWVCNFCFHLEGNKTKKRRMCNVRIDEIYCGDKL